MSTPPPTLRRTRFKVERMNQTAGKIIIDGNSAAALGALFAGVTVVPWYPITPSSSLIETLSRISAAVPGGRRRQGDLCGGAGRG